MNTPIKVRINDTVPEYTAAHEFRGEIVEVDECSHNSEFYRITPAQQAIFVERKAHNTVFTVYKQYVTVIEEPFELKSGMVFKDSRGRYGLIVGTDKGLIAMFGGVNGGYSSFSSMPEIYLKDNGSSTKIVEVFAGMNQKPAAGVNPEQSHGESLWKKEETKKVNLNGEYDAQVYKNSVVVGCQTIPMSAVREIVAIADKL